MRHGRCLPAPLVIPASSATLPRTSSARHFQLTFLPSRPETTHHAPAPLPATPQRRGARAWDAHGDYTISSPFFVSPLPQATDVCRKTARTPHSLSPQLPTVRTRLTPHQPTPSPCQRYWPRRSAAPLASGSVNSTGHQQRSPSHVGDVLRRETSAFQKTPVTAALLP